MAGHYRQLIAWQRGVDFVDLVYDATAVFPKEERYGISSQLQRAAVSIPSNIAEGQGRHSKGEFRQFLGTARGSLLEVETQLHIAVRLGYLEDERSKATFASLKEVARILNGLIGSLGEQKR